MSRLSRDRIDPLIQQIEEQREVVDGRLTRPARWRGQLRRDIKRKTLPKDRKAVAAAFNHLSDLYAAGRGPAAVDTALLLDLQERIGGAGGFRDHHVRIGPHRTTAAPEDVAALVEETCGRAGDGAEPTLLAAARLHMELTLIHPFQDGNGRIARLAASVMLMAAGYRSTLLTAVEQHPLVDPGAYYAAYDLLRAGPTHHEVWLVTALDLMARNSVHAATFRDREISLRKLLVENRVPQKWHDRVLLDHDLQPPRPSRFTKVLFGVPRMDDVIAALPEDEQPRYRNQVRRLLMEEIDQDGDGPNA